MKTEHIIELNYVTPTPPPKTCPFLCNIGWHKYTAWKTEDTFLRVEGAYDGEWDCIKQTKICVHCNKIRVRLEPII